MREVKASEYETEYEYEQAKRQLRKKAQQRRQSPSGRRNFVPVCTGNQQGDK